MRPPSGRAPSAPSRRAKRRPTAPLRRRRRRTRAQNRPRAPINEESRGLEQPQRQGLEFRILGPLEVVRDGQLAPLAGKKQRALLAALIVRANEVVSTDRLIDDVWGENPPRTAA